MGVIADKERGYPPSFTESDILMGWRMISDEEEEYKKSGLVELLWCWIRGILDKKNNK